MRSRTLSSALPVFASCPLWLHAAFLAGLMILRQPTRLLAPQFWAEDGVCWFKDAYDLGAACLLLPHTGYLQTISRLSGLLAAHVPLVLGPAIFVLVALLAQLAPPVYLLSRLGSPLCPSKESRVILAYFYAVIPNAFELHLNLTNAQTHLALLGILVLLGGAPQSRLGLGGQLATLALIGLSGPFSVLLAPFALWQWWQKRDQLATAHATAIGGTALIQGFLLWQSMQATRSTAPLGASLPALARILSGEIVMGSLLGARLTQRLMLLPFWKVDWSPCLIALVALLVIGMALKTGSDSFRKFAAYCALQLSAALIAPQVTLSSPQWEAMGSCMTGTRYFLVPMLTWFGALLVMSQNRHLAGRYLAAILLSVASIGIVGDWTCPPFQFHEEFMEQARLFDRAPPGTEIVIPINPPGWTLGLQKH